MTKKYLYFILSIIILLLAGCDQKPKALSGVYYGDLTSERDKHFQILAFSLKHPDSVGFEEILRGKNTSFGYIPTKKMARMFPVKYEGNKVILTKGAGEDYSLIISQDRNTLSCAESPCRVFANKFEKDKERDDKNSDTIYEKILANTNELEYR